MVIALGDFMSAMCHACIGGTNVREDMRKLEMGVHVVVGTPGRVYDMINRRALSKYYSSHLELEIAYKLVNLMSIITN